MKYKLRSICKVLVTSVLLSSNVYAANDWQYTETIFNTPSGLNGTIAVAANSDASHVYAGGSQGVGVYRRNPANQELELVQTFDGSIVQSSRRPLGISDISLSPNGETVYATGTSVPGLYVFNRDVTTGELSFVEAFRDMSTGLGGSGTPQSDFGSPSEVVVSNDGNHVYVSNGSAFNTGGLLSFSRNTSNGQLTFIEALPGRSTGVAISADDQFVYTSGGVTNTLRVYQRNTSTGQLSQTQVFTDGQDGVDGLSDTRGVAVSPDNKSIYIVGRTDNAVAVFTRDETSNQLSFTQIFRNGLSPIFFPRAVTVSPDGESVYVSNVNELAAFTRNTTTGELTLAQQLHRVNDNIPAIGGDSFGELLVTTDSSRLFVTGSGGLAMFNRSGSASVTFDNTLSAENLTGTITSLSGANISKVSNNGENVYVIGGGTITVFSRNTDTGSLGFLESHSDNIDLLTTLEVSPDDAHVYAYDRTQQAILVFARNAADGSLSFVQSLVNNRSGVQGLSFVRGMVVSPDGAHLYVAGFSDNGIAIFNRDSTNGQLTFNGILKQGDNGITRLGSPSSIFTSTDGSQVYVGSVFPTLLTVFSRDSASGSLTATQSFEDGQNGIDGMNQPTSIISSPDGRFVYVSGDRDRAISIFNRDTGTGQLSFKEFSGLFSNPQLTLNGPRNIVMSSDGSQILAGTFNVVTVLSRDAQTGSVSLHQEFTDNENGVDGLYAGNRVSISPDGKSLYSTAFEEHSIALFSLSTAQGTTLVVNPETETLQTSSQNSLSVDLDLNAQELFAIQVECTTDNTALELGSFTIGNVFPAPPQSLSVNGSDINNNVFAQATTLAGSIDGDGNPVPPPAPLTTSGVFANLVYNAEPVSAIVNISCDAMASDAAGIRQDVTVTNATVTLDNGINVPDGSGQVISGVVLIPEGIDPADVTVTLTIGDATVTVGVDANGVFSFTNVRSGDVVVSVTAPTAVAECANLSVADRAVSTDDISLIRGDINEDGVIDIADFTFLSSRFGLREGQNRFESNADLNGDNVINIQDLAILASAFGVQACQTN